MATFIVSAVILLLVIFVGAHVIREKKEGRTGCGYNCQGCALRGACHNKK